MADSVPKTTPQQQQYPDLNPYADSTGQSQATTTTTTSNLSATASNAASSVLSTAQSTMESIKNSETVQTLASGPVAQKARAETDATKTEFSNLANSRSTPTTSAANGQTLTHYHSFFYTLLSWENPRVTALSYVVIVLSIFFTRYVPIARYALKAAWVVLGITAAAETAGKLLFDQGVASKLRPNKYYTIPRETLESVMEDLVELANFFVIEFQRIVFAENVLVTSAAFVTLFTTYFLIKITPAWGLALIGTTAVYFVPLAYITNKEAIDGHLTSASDALATQTQQVRDLASQHVGKAVELSSSTFHDYSARASAAVGSGKQTAVEKDAISHETAQKLPGDAPSSTAFPTAPKTELPSTTASTTAPAVPAQ